MSEPLPASTRMYGPFVRLWDKRYGGPVLKAESGRHHRRRVAHAGRPRSPTLRRSPQHFSTQRLERVLKIRGVADRGPTPPSRARSLDILEQLLQPPPLFASTTRWHATTDTSRFMDTTPHPETRPARRRLRRGNPESSLVSPRRLAGGSAGFPATPLERCRSV